MHMLHLSDCGGQDHILTLRGGRLISEHHDIRHELEILRMFPLADVSLCADLALVMACGLIRDYRWTEIIFGEEEAEYIWIMRNQQRDWFFQRDKDNHFFIVERIH